MSFARRERRGVSFAFRLNAWYTAVIAGALLVLGVGSRLLLAEAIESADRAVIRARLEELVSLVWSGRLEALAARLERKDSRPIAVRVADAQGRTLLLHVPQNGLEFDLDSVELEQREGDRLWLELSTIDHSERWRMGAALLGSGERLEVLISEEPGRRVLAAYDHRLALILPVGVALGLLGGLWLTQRTRRPIRALIETTREVLASRSLARRVPIRATGDELDELGELYNRMLEQNQRLLQGMRDALDNVAHDLRTPLTRLRVSAENVLAQQGDPAAAREALADCVEESERATAMLAALMDISEAETGMMRLDKRKVDLTAVAAEVADLYAHVAEDRQIGLANEARTPVLVDADPTRLRQAVANLVDNAIKYTPAGGRVVIRTDAAGDRAAIEVEDTGIGIPAGEHERIFERLYRGDKSRSERGLGLGLSFVRAIVEAHGGLVTVESEEGRGARFRIALPGEGKSWSQLPDLNR